MGIALKNPPKTRRTPDSQRSLFGEILDWMLAPLLFVWPISIVLTHYFANNVAAFPYDQALREDVAAISRQLKFVNGKPVINLPGAARAVIRSDEIDSVYFHVLTRNGRVLAGDQEFPLPDQSRLAGVEPGEIHFRDDELNGRELRVAYSYLHDVGMPPGKWVLVEVGETLEKRAQLANKIIASVIIPQFIIIPLAVLLVWFGLTKGLQPLTRLRETIEARQSADLSPISNRRVPEELEPLIGAFNAMLERMKRNVDAQQRFIADAAHQMRTPLAGLKTQAQLALRESNPRQLQNSLRQIATGVDRASRLVNQLLTLARTEAGDQLHQQQDPLDLDQLLREVVGDWVMRAVEDRIDLGFETSGPAIIRGNPFLLRELVNNLIDNALRYTPEGGQVTCRVVGHGDFAILEVEDSGVGISEAQSERVFERFCRVDDAATEGSGLGLAIVREIAGQHRASASLSPNPKGRGAIARVIFPAWHLVHPDIPPEPGGHAEKP